MSKTVSYILFISLLISGTVLYFSMKQKKSGNKITDDLQNLLSTPEMKVLFKTDEFKNVFHTPEFKRLVFDYGTSKINNLLS